MLYCPKCFREYAADARLCGVCSMELVNSESPELDPEMPILIYRSYSRINTDFLSAALRSAEIPFNCLLIGGLMGRGGALTVGIFQPSNQDALFLVPAKYREEALELKKQIVGAEQE